MSKLILGFSFLFMMVTVGYGQESRFAYGGLNEKQVREQIREANYCEVKEDCVMAYLGCPYECSIAVHKDKLAQLQRDARESMRLSGVGCNFMCDNPINLDCVNRQCVAEYKRQEQQTNMPYPKKNPDKSNGPGEIVTNHPSPASAMPMVPEQGITEPNREGTY